MTFQLFPGDTIVTRPTSCRCGADVGMYIERGCLLISLGCACHHVLTLETVYTVPPPERDTPSQPG